MFALPTPNRPDTADSFFECGGVVLNWAVLVAVILILLTFGTIAPSHACQDRNNPAPHATQATTKLIAKQSAVAASVAKPAIMTVACYDDKSDHHYGFVAGSCCPGCTAGMISAGWSAAQNLILKLDFPPPQTYLSLIQSDSQFRPPRTTLLSSSRSNTPSPSFAIERRSIGDN